jgi:Gpi18-like mannosyltransferase
MFSNIRRPRFKKRNKFIISKAKWCSSRGFVDLFKEEGDAVIMYGLIQKGERWLIVFTRFLIQLHTGFCACWF